MKRKAPDGCTLGAGTNGTTFRVVMDCNVNVATCGRRSLPMPAGGELECALKRVQSHLQVDCTALALLRVDRELRDAQFHVAFEIIPDGNACAVEFTAYDVTLSSYARMLLDGSVSLREYMAGQRSNEAEVLAVTDTIPSAASVASSTSSRHSSVRAFVDAIRSIPAPTTSNAAQHFTTYQQTFAQGGNDVLEVIATLSYVTLTMIDPVTKARTQIRRFLRDAAEEIAIQQVLRRAVDEGSMYISHNAKAPPPPPY
jgi:hypothetical protein